MIFGKRGGHVRNPLRLQDMGVSTVKRAIRKSIHSTDSGFSWAMLYSKGLVEDIFRVWFKYSDVGSIEGPATIRFQITPTFNNKSCNRGCDRE